MTRDRGSRDLAVAGAILSLVALVAVFAPGQADLGVAIAFVALALGCAALLLPRRSRRLGAAISLVALGVLALGIVRLPSASAPERTMAIPEAPAGPTAESPTTSISDAAGTPTPTADQGAAIIAYEISTDGMSVTHLSYVDLVGGRPTMVEELGVPPPFRHDVAVPAGTDVDLTDLSVTGMGGASSRRTTCTITVDGREVARNSADGAYGLVTCAVPAP